MFTELMPQSLTAEAITRQEPFINQTLAYQALAMLTQLLRHGSVSYRGGFCNVATGKVAPLPIRAVPARAQPNHIGSGLPTTGKLGQTAFK